MIHNDKSGWLTIALFTGGFVTFMTLAVSILLFGDVNMIGLVLLFLITFSAVMVLPLGAALVDIKHRVELSRLQHKIDIAIKNYELSRVGYQPPSKPNGYKPAYSDHWRLYWLAWLTYCKDTCKGSITFTACHEFFGRDRARALETFNLIIRPLSREGLVNPIVSGKPTAFANGVSLAGVLEWLGAENNVSYDYIPLTHPPEPFKAFPDAIRETPDNAGETRETVVTA